MRAHRCGCVTGSGIWCSTRTRSRVLVTDLGGVGDPYSRRAVERFAVCVERWPVHGLIACAAGPGGVAAAVTEAGLVTDEDLVSAERMPVRASELTRPAQLPAYPRNGADADVDGGQGVLTE